MTGYQSKKAMAQDKLAQPAQEPWPEEPVGHMAGGVQPPQRPWVDLTPQDLNEIFAIARTGEHAVRLALDKSKEKNNAA